MDKPRNIFEQILFGVKTTNDNVVALSEDLALVHQKIDAIYNALYPPIQEPTADGVQEIVGETQNPI
jgi:hypothetical protein